MDYGTTTDLETLFWWMIYLYHGNDTRRNCRLTFLTTNGGLNFSVLISTVSSLESAISWIRHFSVHFFRFRWHFSQRLTVLSWWHTLQWFESFSWDLCISQLQEYVSHCWTILYSPWHVWWLLERWKLYRKYIKIKIYTTNANFRILIGLGCLRIVGGFCVDSRC